MVFNSVVVVGGVVDGRGVSCNKVARFLLMVCIGNGSERMGPHVVVVKMWGAVDVQ